MAVNSTVFDWKVLKSLKLHVVQPVQIAATNRDIGKCALLLTESGKVFAIGKRSVGCLGLGEVTETAEPVELKELSGVAGVCVCGNWGDALAYTSEGKVYVWGNNVSWNRPQLVPELTDVVDARCRGGHYLALTKSGKLYEWRGVTTCCSELGITTTLSTTPKVVTLNEVITSIACGPIHSLALTKDGQVYSWGFIINNGLINQPMTQITLPGETVAKIACGALHSLVLTHSGKLYTWGYNDYGLGDPSGSIESQLPVQVGQNIGRFVDIAVNGSRTNAAVSNTGEVYMWGDGENGAKVKTPTITEHLEMHQVFANITWSNYSWTPKTPSSNTVVVKDSSSVAGKLKAICNDEQDCNEAAIIQSEGHLEQSQTNADCDHAESKIHNLEEYVKNLKKELAELKEDNTKLKDELREVNAKLKKDNAILKEENIKLKEDLKEDHAKLKEDIVKLRDELREENAKLKEENFNLKDENYKFKNELKEDHAKLKDELREENATLREHNVKRKEENYKFKNELKVDHAKFKDEIREDNAKLIDDLKEENYKLKNELKVDHAKFKDEIREDNAKLIDDLKEENYKLKNELKVDHAKFKDEIREDNAKLIDDLKEENYKLKNELKEDSAKLAEAEELKENNAKLQDQFKYLKAFILPQEQEEKWKHNEAAITQPEERGLQLPVYLAQLEHDPTNVDSSNNIEEDNVNLRKELAKLQYEFKNLKALLFPQERERSSCEDNKDREIQRGRRGRITPTTASVTYKDNNQNKQNEQLKKSSLLKRGNENRTIDSFFAKKPKNISNDKVEVSPGSSAVISQGQEMRPEGQSVRTPASISTEPTTFFSDIEGTNLDDHTKAYLLQSPWIPPADYEFPHCVVNKKGKPTKKYAQRAHLDKFHWLVLSHKDQGLYCKYCVLFGKNIQRNTHPLGRLVKQPLKVFDDLLGEKGALMSHERNQYHKTAVELWKHFLMAYHNPTLEVVNMVSNQRKTQAEENRQRLRPIVSTIILCGRQNIPLRGHRANGSLNKSMYLSEETSDNDNQSVVAKNDGNFRALLRFRIEAGDKQLEAHMNSAKSNATYISNKTQNKLIDACKEEVQSIILKRVREARFFSVIFDELTDLSHTSQLSLSLRYIYNHTIREDFITFCDAYSSIRDEDIEGEERLLTGKAIAHIVEDLLSKFDVDVKNCVCIGVDSCSTMASDVKGAGKVFMEKVCLRKEVSLCQPHTKQFFGKVLKC